MIYVDVRNASSAIPLKVVQTVENHFVVIVPTNVTVGMKLAAKVALKSIVNVNTMDARGKTVMTVMKQNNTIWNIVTSVRIHAALNADT